VFEITILNIFKLLIASISSDVQLKSAHPAGSELHPPSPFSQTRKRGERFLKVPPPALGEGFRVREFRIVAHRVCLSSTPP
jgi:hypothetical protein